MSKTLSALAVLLLLAGCKSPAAGEAPETSTEAAAVPEQSVEQVASALKQKRVVAVDANGSETREKYGVVPGAILLSSHTDYAISELPSDKNQPLVFYCGGTLCRASDKAAGRAASAGYAHVSVMREGIKGWASSGQPTSSLPKS